MYFEPDARTHRPACCCATYTSTCGYKSASSNTRKRLFTGKGRQRATGRARSKVPTLNLFPARGLTEKRRKLFGGGPVSQGVAEEIYKNTSSGNFLEQPLLPSHESRNKGASFLEGVPFPRGLPKRFTKTRLQATFLNSPPHPAMNQETKAQAFWRGSRFPGGCRRDLQKHVFRQLFLEQPPPPNHEWRSNTPRGLWFGPLPWRLRLPNGHFGSFGNYPKHFHKEKNVFFSYALLVLCWCSAGALLVLSWCSVCSLQKEHKSPIPKGFRVQTFAVTAAPPKRPFLQL